MASKEKLPALKADWTDVIRPVAEDPLACDGHHDHRIQWYNDNAETYEIDTCILNYFGPFYVAMTTVKFLEGCFDVKILDVGGGTGLAAQQLQKLGSFKEIDVIDPAENLVKLATDRGIYNKTYIRYFEENCGISAETYDVVISCGAFAPGHVPVNSVREMFKLLKPGGFLVIGVRNMYMETDPDTKTLPAELNRLAKAGICTWLEHSLIPIWADDMPGTIFAYRKTSA